MLSLTRKTDYALVALTYLAEQRSTTNSVASSGVSAVSARKIADQFGMPLPLLMNILKELTQAQIIRSTRGINGGYELAIEPQDVTLLDVVTAMEGHPKFAACTDDHDSCQISHCCNIREPIRRLHERMQQFFKDVTLADLMQSKVDVPLTMVRTPLPEPVTSGV